MKTSNIYRTKGKYIIITQSKSDIGLGIADDPIYILPITCKIEELKNKLFDSLQKSRTDVPTPKRNEWIIWQKIILEKMHEKSFNNLYKNSTSCLILLENGILKIQPERFCTPKDPQSGLCPVYEDEVTFEKSKTTEDEIIIKILEILDISYR